MVDLVKIYKNRFRDRCFTFDKSVRLSHCDMPHRIDHFCTARRGELYAKQFIGERDFDMVFAVDASSSQMFGSAEAKIDFALKLVDKLSNVACKVGDRAGLILFSEGVDFYKPACTNPHVPDLKNRKFGVKSDPGVVVKFLQNTLKCSSVVFFISDFLYPDKIRDSLIGAFRTLARRHDFVCVWLRDRVDVAIPAVGKLRVQDAESLDCLCCDPNNRRFSNIYGDIHAKWAGKLCRDVEKAGLKLVTIDGGCAIELAIKKCLDKHLHARKRCDI
jgi:uncharacterized protein (DUF58 family)